MSTEPKRTLKFIASSEVKKVTKMETSKTPEFPPSGDIAQTGPSGESLYEHMQPENMDSFIDAVIATYENGDSGEASKILAVIQKEKSNQWQKVIDIWPGFKDKKEVTSVDKTNAFHHFFTFTPHDAHLLIKLYALKDRASGLTLLNLINKISDDIVHDIDFGASSAASEIATRNDDYYQEAIKARIQFLCDYPDSTILPEDLLRRMSGIFARPAGIKQDLKELRGHLEAHRSALGGRTSKLLTKIEKCLDSHQTIESLNSFALETRAILKGLATTDYLKAWPSAYANYMNPPKSSAIGKT